MRLRPRSVGKNSKCRVRVSIRTCKNGQTNGLMPNYATINSSCPRLSRHPRCLSLIGSKAWMAGTSQGKPGHDGRESHPLTRLVLFPFAAELFKLGEHRVDIELLAWLLLLGLGLARPHSRLGGGKERRALRRH